MNILKIITEAMQIFGEQGYEPTHKEVAEVTGINEDTVFRVLVSMAKEELVDITHNSGTLIKPRKKKTTNISDTSSLFRSYGVISNYDDYQALVPNWVDDLIRGSITTNMGNGTQKISTYRLFKLMCSITEVNTDTVASMINPSKVNKDGSTYSLKTIEMYTNAIVGLHSRIQHHLPNFDREPKTKDYKSEGLEGTETPMMCYMDTDEEPVVKEIMTDAFIQEIADKYHDYDSNVDTYITNRTINIDGTDYEVDLNTGEIKEYIG